MSSPPPRLGDFDRDNGQAGIFASTAPHAGMGTVQAVANRLYAVRFVPSRNHTIASMVVVVQTQATADDACDVAIFDDAGAVLVAKGATTGQMNSTGRKVLDITDTALTAGEVYYAGFSYGAVGGTAATLMGTTFNNLQGTRFFGTTLPAVELAFESNAHPINSSLVADATGIGSAPAIALLDA